RAIRLALLPEPQRAHRADAGAQDRLGHAAAVDDLLEHAHADRLGGHGTNADTRAWYARYRSPFERNACASVAGMPVTRRMLPRMIAGPSHAAAPKAHGSE